MNSLEPHNQEQLIQFFQIEFVKNNRAKSGEFSGALESGDIKLAYRIAHTIKSNARQLGRAELAEIAEEIEHLIADGVNRLTETHISRFTTELDKAVTEFSPLLQKTETAIPQNESAALKNSLLIVNDDTTGLNALVYILQPTYTIFTATNGADAIKLAEAEAPDLIILDIVMPEMDGYTVISQLRSIEKTKNIPVIFVTSLNSLEDEVKGLLYNAADYISVPYNADIVRLRVRNQITIVNQIRTIQRLVLIDQLTGIPNRRYFDEQLRQNWGMAVREEKAISILMLDIDKFKSYNDTYGHQQGDVALKSTANAAMKTLKRASDFIARWGGEEFIALLPNTDLAGAMNIAEQMRKNIESTDIPCTGNTVRRVTVSIGVNSLKPVNTTSVDGFISGADEALYMAKKLGRNRVCPYQ